MPDIDAIPQWTPTQRELDDLDLLVAGAFAPQLDGFANPDTGGDGSAITLVVSADAAELALAAGALDLIDPEGAPLARLTPASTWDAGEDRVGLAGSVKRLAHNAFGPFRQLHLTPEELHQSNPRAGLIAVPVSRPLTIDDLATIDEAALRDDATPLLIACVGDSMPEDISGPALVRATIAAAALLDRPGLVVAAAVADHGDAANEWLLTSVASAYAANIHALASTSSGELPDQVAAIAAKDRPPRDKQGVVIFFTGLSGSGKSTLARALVDHILEQGERTVTSLDGDVVRHHLSKGLGFSREDRETNILRIGYVAAEIARHGGIAICSPIAPFESTRAEVRRMVESAGGGFELIHVSTPLEECERRDRKGLYAKARRGEIPDFTGISSPYEVPKNAFRIDTSSRDIAECLDELLNVLYADGWLRSSTGVKAT